MDIPEIIFIWIPLAVAASYIGWAVVRSSRWARLQEDSAEGQRALVARSLQAEEEARASIKLQDEQLRLTRELVAHVEALREDLSQTQPDLVARSGDAARSIAEIVRLHEEQLRLVRDLAADVRALRDELGRRGA